MIIGKNILQKPQNHKKYTIKYENLYFYFMLCILWNTFKKKSLAFTPKLKNRTNVKMLRWYDR